MVFVQDTFNFGGFIQTSSSTIENLCRHIFRIPRYRSKDVRFARIAYHDPCVTSQVDFTSDLDDFIRGLVPSQDDTNTGLSDALSKASRFGWRDGADKVIVVLTPKDCRRLGSIYLCLASIHNQ